MQVDHINRDGLDNRRHNLRFCTNAQNNHCAPYGKGTSKYKGVSWQKKSKRWIVSIKHNGKVLSLGRFNGEDEAALAYNKKAQALWGEFAYINKTKQ